jgi:hypothetical protein
MDIHVHYCEHQTEYQCFAKYGPAEVQAYALDADQTIVLTVAGKPHKLTLFLTIGQARKLAAELGGSVEKLESAKSP